MDIIKLLFFVFAAVAVLVFTSVQPLATAQQNVHGDFKSKVPLIVNSHSP